MTTQPYDLEEKIMDCWHIVDELNTVAEHIVESPATAETKDDVSNMLIGLHTLYQIKFEKLFSVFEDYLKCQKSQ